MRTVVLRAAHSALPTLDRPNHSFHDACQIGCPTENDDEVVLLIDVEEIRVRMIRRSLSRLLADQRGQATAEYGLLTWFLVLIGTTTLAYFFFAMGEVLIGYYDDIVCVVCLPVP